LDKYLATALKNICLINKLKPIGATKMNYIDAIVDHFGSQALDDAIINRK
jgi:hypothetical protein